MRLVIHSLFRTLPALLLVAPLTVATAQRGRGGRGGASPNGDQVAPAGDSGSTSARRGGTGAATSHDVIAMTEAAPVVSHHTISVRGQTINYTASAGMLPIRNAQTDAVEAGMYYVAYTKDGANTATRPIPLACSGARGSARVGGPRGAWGRKRVKPTPEGGAPP